MKSRWIVTAFGKDRPGIVAGVAKILYQRGCNLEDSAMTRLEGEFAIMLIFSAGPAMTAERLQTAFEPLQRRMRLAIHLKRLTKPETATPRARGRRYLISVYGADRPGIVAHVSELLARSGANIVDVHTHRSVASGVRRGPSLYLLVLEVELSRTVSAPSVERKLKHAAQRLHVEVNMHPADVTVL